MRQKIINPFILESAIPAGAERKTPQELFFSFKPLALFNLNPAKTTIGTR